MAKSLRADQPADDANVTVDFLLGLDEPDTIDGKQVFKIGDLSREFSVTLRTLRFYEDRGLLSPERRGTTRLYDRRDRTHLRLILLAKLLGFSLTEAKQIIEIYHEPDGARKQMEVALDRFNEQQEILEDQKREIEQSIEAMNLTIDVVRKRFEKLSTSATPKQ